MSAKVDKVRKSIEGFNAHDYERSVADMAADAAYVDVATGIVSAGLDAIKNLGAAWHAGFSDAQQTDCEYTETDDGRVLVEFVGRGTQDGRFGPFEPKGGSFEVSALQLVSFNDAGEIAHVDLYYDSMTMLSQLGHLPGGEPSSFGYRPH